MSLTEKLFFKSKKQSQKYKKYFDSLLKHLKRELKINKPVRILLEEDEKNAKKTVDELKAIVVKNLAKDPLYYTKNGEFGVAGVGYTDEAPGLGKNTQPKTKEATVLGGHDKVESTSEIVKNSAIEAGKKNVQDTLGSKEAKTSMPKKVKEMEVAPQNSKGVKKMSMPGKEKKMKLQEGNLGHNEEWSLEPEGRFWILTYSTMDGKKEKTFDSEDEAKKWIKQNLSEQKLRSVIRNIIKEELDENKTLIKKGDVLYHENSGATLEVIDVEPETVTMKVTKIEEKTPKYIKVGQTSKTTPSAIGKTYTKK